MQVYMCKCAWITCACSWSSKRVHTPHCFEALNTTSLLAHPEPTILLFPKSAHLDKVLLPPLQPGQLTAATEPQVHFTHHQAQCPGRPFGFGITWLSHDHSTTQHQCLAKQRYYSTLSYRYKCIHSWLRFDKVLMIPVPPTLVHFITDPSLLSDYTRQMQDTFWGEPELTQESVSVS